MAATIDWYKIINYYYSCGNYTIDDVKKYVVLGKITDVQFKEITGQDYTA